MFCIFVKKKVKRLYFVPFIYPFTNRRHFMQGSRRRRRLKKSFSNISTRLWGSDTHINHFKYSNLDILVLNIVVRYFYSIFVWLSWKQRYNSLDSIQMLQFDNSSFSGAPRPGETHWAIEGCSQGQGPATQSGSGTFFYMVTIIHTTLLSFMAWSLKQSLSGKTCDATASAWRWSLSWSRSCDGLQSFF